MNQYTIYCTEEQTKKALELGAPLEIAEGKNTVLCRLHNYHTYKRCVIPTAEQMIGWLQEQGLCIEPYRTACGYKCTISKVPSGTHLYGQQYEGDDEASGQFTTRGKSILAAIDVALEYLSNQKSK